MILNEQRIEAYLEKKGWAPVANDSQWEKCVTAVRAVTGESFRFRVKTIVQKEDPLRRFHTCFPQDIPRPYRFIDSLEFGVYSKKEDRKIVEEVRAVVESNGVIFELKDDAFWNGEADEQGWTICLRGFKETIVQQGASQNAGKPAS